MRLAYALLATSPADALRRVVVMAVEDAALHPQLPAVVWMMCAVAKGFALSADHIALVLRIVWDIASAHISDSFPEDDASASGIPGALCRPLCLHACSCVTACRVPVCCSFWCVGASQADGACGMCEFVARCL